MKTKCLYHSLEGLWINAIGYYTSDIDDIRYCPRSKKRESLSGLAWGSSRQTWVWDIGTVEPEQGSYALNGWFYSNHASQPEEYYYRKTSQAVSPANVPVFADAVWVDVMSQDTDTVPANYDLDREGGGFDQMCHVIINRHDGEGNVGFLDGSQRPVELSAMWSLKWNRKFKITAEKFRDDGSPIYRNTR